MIVVQSVVSLVNQSSPVPISKLGVVLTVVVAALHAGVMMKPISAWSRRIKKRYKSRIVSRILFSIHNSTCILW